MCVKLNMKIYIVNIVNYNNDTKTCLKYHNEPLQLSPQTIEKYPIHANQDINELAMKVVRKHVAEDLIDFVAVALAAAHIG